MCSRFFYGISANSNFAGIFNYGADVRFKKWGKLQAELDFSTVNLKTMQRIDRIDRYLLSIISPIARIWNALTRKRKVNMFINYGKIRTIIIHFLFSARDRDSIQIDDFVLEAFSPQRLPFSLMIEILIDEQVRFRNALHIQPGSNIIKIPFKTFGVNINELVNNSGMIRIFPEADADVRLIFQWLNFVKYKDSLRTSLAEPRSKPRHGSKTIKCVVWDLDNTLWGGILGEVGQHGVKPIEAAIDLVRAFDQRGILQSVASKNDYLQAWETLMRIRVSEYFLYPEINWGPKSQSIRRIAANLNIGLDTFVFIDDSPFERGEVEENLPQVRVYDPENLGSLLTFPEFDVPITAESRQRRGMYIVEAERKQDQSLYGDNHLNFIRSCKLEAEIFVPVEPSHVKRCLELIQRTNQLNISGRRYEADEFREILREDGRYCLAARCRDRYGEYGLVCFLSVELLDDVAKMTDFVMSCRVAKRRVEHAIFQFLLERLKQTGRNKLVIEFVHSERNGVMLASIEEMDFNRLERVNGRTVFVKSCDEPISESNIVKVKKGVDTTLGEALGDSASTRK